MSGEAIAVDTVEQITVEAARAPVPPSITMPDHQIRHATAYQLFVRLARPTLDWVTIAWFVWVTMVQPVRTGTFDVVACGMALAWCAAVYGIKTWEKLKGVA